MKTIVINLTTAKGLDKSIRKWEKVVATGCGGAGTEGCGLCDLFNSQRGFGCGDCPVKIDTGVHYCKATPFNDYCRAVAGSKAEAKHAKNELAYLVDLKSRCEVKARVLNHVEEAKL